MLTADIVLSLPDKDDDAVTFPVVAKLVPSKLNAEPVANALEDEAYTTPPEVNEVRPVPPLVVANVPANVTAPDVAVEGVKPVVPAENVVTPSAVLDATFT